MPSPILKYLSGKFKHMESGVMIVASKKYPVYAYRRNTTSNKSTKGAYGYVPRGKKKVSYRVSIVRARGISSHSRDASRVSTSTVAVPHATYRQTSDWTHKQGQEPKARAFPKGRGPRSKPKGKTKVPRKPKKVVGRGVEVTKKDYDKYMAKAKKERKQATKKKQVAEDARTPATQKKKAKEAVTKAKQSKRTADKVIDSKKAPKSAKKAARATKRAAKETEKAAEKIIAKAKKAEAKKKKKAKKKSSVRTVMK